MESNHLNTQTTNDRNKAQLMQGKQRTDETNGTLTEHNGMHNTQQDGRMAQTTENTNQAQKG